MIHITPQNDFLWILPFWLLLPVMGNIITTIVTILSVVAEVATTVWQAVQPVVTTIYNVAMTVYDVFSAAWKWVSEVWDFVKPFYDWVKNEIWPYVKWCVDQINSIYKYIDNAVGKIEKWIDTAYNTIFGKIYEIWGRIDKLTDDVSRIVAIFDKKLAQEIQKTKDEIYKNTLGRIDELYGEIRGWIDRFREDILNRMGEFVRLVNKNWNMVQSTVSSFETFMKGAFEDQVTLKDATVKQTTRKYGMTMWNELQRHVQFKGTLSDTKRLQGVSPKSDLDQYIELMDQGLEGSWADVEYNISHSVFLMDEGKDIEDLQIDPVFWTEQERKDFQDLTGKAAQFEGPPEEKAIGEYAEQPEEERGEVVE